MAFWYAPRCCSRPSRSVIPSHAAAVASRASFAVAAWPAPRVGVADQGDELAQRLVHPELQASPEGALQGALVLGHLTADRLHDLGRDRGQLGLDRVGELGG